MSEQVKNLPEKFSGSSDENMALLPDIHDRITEAYFGKLGDNFARSTQERVHWVCSNVKGKRVLDVGCSQGIAALLLGREGKTVVGIDFAKRSIEEAREYLARESVQVQEQVRFIQGDFLTANLETYDFETVIIAEVLEHLINPEAFISAAAIRLKKNGQLIVTVPFGVNDFPDHKKTFYLSEPWRIISKHFYINEVKFFGKWIGFVATLRCKKELQKSFSLREDDIAQSEVVFQKIERRLLERVKTLTKEVTEKQTELLASNKQNTALKKSMAESETARVSLGQSLTDLQERAQSTEITLEVYRAEMQETEARLSAEKTNLAEENYRAKIQLKELKIKILDLNEAIKDSKSAYDSLQVELFEEKSLTSAKDKEISRLVAELSASERWAKHHEIEAQKKSVDLEAERSSHVESETRRLLTEHKIEGMASRLVDYETQLENAKQSFLEQTHKLALLQSQHEQLRAKQDDKEKELTSLSEEIDAAKARELTLTEETKGLRGLIRKERQARETQEKKKIQADERADRQRKTLSFRLGNTLIFGFKSWKGFRSLLFDLIKLKREWTQYQPEKKRPLPRLMGEHSSKRTYEPRKNTSSYSQCDDILEDCGPLKNVSLDQRNPIWCRIPVVSGQELTIEANLECSSVNGGRDRKAVLLFNAFDAVGALVDKPMGKLAKSSHFNAYFKYLPCTQNKLQKMHTFIVPEGIAEIRLGISGFNKRDDEQVVLRELRVTPNPDISQTTQFVPPSAQAAKISILGWPEQPPNGKPYVIGIMDEFTTGCFEQEVNLIQPRPDNWHALAEKYQPEFFFIESAWKGNYGSWQYRVADYANKPGQEVAHICQYAREKGIPTLFWNKEDPVHHEKFMCSASLVDHIFTTDSNMKESYQAKTGHPNVHALPFAAQPALHKPAPLSVRKPRACFAGSWYGNRHAERGEGMRWLLQAAKRHGLDIFDRNHGTDIFPFPEEYQADIKGNLPYKALCQEYSRYRVFLNVNSVTDSPTMFSRRVFELMACGTPVVSTYAMGIDTLFDSDAVWLVHSQEEADAALHTLMTDDAEWRRRSLAGIREVFAKHTYTHRLNDIFDRLGIKTGMPTDPPIALVADAHSQAELEALQRFAHKQSYRSFQLGITCSPAGLARLASPLSENITLLQRDQKADWLAEQHAGSPLVGWLSPEAHYGEHYLRDLANASLYQPEAGGWAKALDEDRFTYGGQVSLSGVLWKRAEFLKQSIQIHPKERITRPDLFLADCDQFQAACVAQQAVGG